MHDEPRNDASDPSELTQRHAVPPVDPAVSSAAGRAVRSSGRAVADPAEPEPGRRGVDPDSDLDGRPPRRPLHAGPRSRAPTGRDPWDQVTPVTPERWYEPAPTPAPTAPATTARRDGRRRRVAGRGRRSCPRSSHRAARSLALGAAGALDRPAAAVDLAGRPPTPAPSSRSRSMNRRRRSRSRRQGQPGRRPDHGHRRHPTPATSGSSPRPASARASSSTATAGS